MGKVKNFRKVGFHILFSNLGKQKDAVFYQPGLYLVHVSV